MRRQLESEGTFTRPIRLRALIRLRAICITVKWGKEGCWSSVSITPFLRVESQSIMKVVLQVSHEVMVGNTIWSTSPTVRLTCWQRWWSRTASGRRTAYWGWCCCLMVVVAWILRKVFQTAVMLYANYKALRRMKSGGMLASTSILDTRMQLSAPRHIRTR